MNFYYFFLYLISPNWHFMVFRLFPPFNFTRWTTLVSFLSSLKFLIKSMSWAKIIDMIIQIMTCEALSSFWRMYGVCLFGLHMLFVLGKAVHASSSSAAGLYCWCNSDACSMRWDKTTIQRRQRLLSGTLNLVRDVSGLLTWQIDCLFDFSSRMYRHCVR